jgi:hypothetical protein
MGASEWVYWVSYQPDIREALEQARAEAFQSHQYFDAVQYRLSTLMPDYQRTGEWELSNYVPERYRPTEDDLRRWQSRPQPETTEDLIKIQALMGTHCVIDIEGIAPTRDPGMAAPLSTEDLVAFFGTQRPTPDQVAARQDDVCALCDRGEAVYITTYTGAVPDQIAFLGVTGD